MEQEYIGCVFAFSPKCPHIDNSVISNVLLLVNQPGQVGGTIPQSKIETANTLCNVCKFFSPKTQGPCSQEQNLQG
jgi:hypothetical protein